MIDIGHTRSCASRHCHRGQAWIGGRIADIHGRHAVGRNFKCIGESMIDLTGSREDVERQVRALERDLAAALAALDDAQFAAHKQRELEVVNANIMREFAQWRDDALAEIKAQTQRMAVLECVLAAMTVERDAALKQLAAETMEPRCVEAERDALRAALCMIYDKWEDGTRCFDESENDLGNAFRLDKEEEDSILALIPKERYATTDKS